MKTILFCFSVLLYSCAFCQVSPPETHLTVAGNPGFAISYRLPFGVQDETVIARSENQKRASNFSQFKSNFELLLAGASGHDTSAAEWRALSVQAYPRANFQGIADADAEAKISALVIGSKASPTRVQRVPLAGQDFIVSVFGRQDGNTRKGAVVWTTLRNGKLLCFTFVANSAQQLMTLNESMKSVRFD